MPIDLDTAPKHQTRMPTRLVWAILAVCVAPALLSWGGVDFGTNAQTVDLSTICTMPAEQVDDTLHRSLAGSFTHTILQWSAFCTAVFTVILAFAHFAIKRDAATPVIAMALFCAGCMDAFRTLTANRMIETVADNADLIPFTWALSRIFGAVIIMAGVGLTALRKRDARNTADVPFVAAACLTFAALAFALLQYCATGAWLPRTQFPESLINRPYDLIPLTLYLFAFAFVLRPFHARERSIFSHALIITLIPEMAAQLYVVFGSRALFDSAFNIAHFLKVIAYAVPFVGLVLDYLQTYRLQGHQAKQLSMYALEMREAKTEIELKANLLSAHSEELRQFTAQLEHSNRELEEFARIASHDLQEPLRKVQAFGDRLKTKYSDALPEAGREYVDRMQNATARMQDLINDLLKLSRVSTQQHPNEPVDLAALATQVLADLEVRIEETGGTVELVDLPTLHADATQMRQLLQNLIGNALKYNRPGVPPVVRVEAATSDDGQCVELTVRDNGIGFDMKHADRIFCVFQRLHGREEYEGTGVGLAVCRKIVERHQGTITAHSIVGEGSVFTVTLPAMSQEERKTSCAA